MTERLSATVHIVPNRGAVEAMEAAVVNHWKPPLNQDGVEHRWRAMVKRAREATGQQATRSAAAGGELAAMVGKIDIDDVSRELRGKPG
jgi:hypothetical protein